MSVLTAKQLRVAGKWRKQGKQWAWIALQFGVATQTVKRALDPQWAERRREQINEARRRVGEGRAAHTIPHRASSEEKFGPPAHVLAERDARTARQPTRGQVLYGDPAPGRSALDQRRGRNA